MGNVSSVSSDSSGFSPDYSVPCDSFGHVTVGSGLHFGETATVPSLGYADTGNSLAPSPSFNHVSVGSRDSASFSEAASFNSVKQIAEANAHISSRKESNLASRVSHSSNSTQWQLVPNLLNRFSRNNAHFDLARHSFKNQGTSESKSAHGRSSRYGHIDPKREGSSLNKSYACA